MLLKPDPTFYASPKDAINAPPETLAYVALLSATGNGVPDRIGVIDTDSTSPRYATEIGGVTLSTTGTNCITSVGMPAAQRCVRSRRIRTSNGATSSFRDCALRASTSSIRNPIPRSRASCA